MTKKNLIDFILVPPKFYLFFNLFANCCLLFRPLLTLHIVYLFMFLRRESFKLKFSYLSFLVCLYTANIGVLFNRKNFFQETK